jgi:alpha,alpha-trehalase
MTKSNRIFRCRMVLALGLFCIVLPASGFAGADETEREKTKGLEPILTYIAKSWDTLTRSMEDCSTVVDPKLAEHSVLYLPADVPVSAQVEDMQRR